MIKKFDFNYSNLEDYVLNDFPAIYDYFILSSHQELQSEKATINKFLQLRRGDILALDFTNKSNLAFLSLLLDISERLRFRSSFRYLYAHLQHYDFSIGKRLEASAHYIQLTHIEDFIAKFDIICSLLQESLNMEEDDIDRILITFINYYATVIDEFAEFNLKMVQKFRELISSNYEKGDFPFLKTGLIKETLDIEPKDFNIALCNIHSLIEKYFTRVRTKENFTKSFLIENGSEYCDVLKNVQCNFLNIRQLSVNKCKTFDCDRVYSSLGRGEVQLSSEQQMFSYIKSYGKMHYEKLMVAFQYLPQNLFNSDLSIIDWGCGQGIATMALLDHFAIMKISPNIKNITLIEPSEIALKRASLHINKYFSANRIVTIKNELDALTSPNILDYGTAARVHLFSNVLDMNRFSLRHLIDLIKSTYSGVNCFICVSPYIDDIRKSRLDSFMRSFTQTNHFTQLKVLDKKSKTLEQNWTLILRIYCVEF